jgi:transcriptional regulator
MSRDPLDLLPGTLEFLVLETLGAGEERHGFGILAWIRERTGDDVLRIEEGALYPALHRMERRGWLASRWRISDRNHRAKFYRLTAAGRKRLAQEQIRWNRYVAAVGRITAARSSGQ